MSRRRTIGLAAVATAALAFAPAAATAAPKDNGASIQIRGGMHFKAGHHVLDDQRFVGTTTVKAGKTIKVVNKATAPDPHTISFVAKKDLPKSFADMESPAIGGLMGAHEVPEGGQGQPGKPVVNVGAEGFDAVGDSYFFMGKSYSIPVAKTAKKGTYNYLCLIHPWMQGVVKVK
jgi:plastocyanin